MCSPLLSREVALRVGLASSVLDGIDAKTLIPALIGMVGLPLTKDRLAKITVTGLKHSLPGAVDKNTPQADDAATSASRTLPQTDSFKTAVRYLWGFTDEDEQRLPQFEDYSAGDMPGSIRVGFATTDGELLDQHFGGCLRFFVYQVSPAEVRLVDFRSVADSVDAEDPTAYRAELLQDCHVLYVQSIGGPAAAKVIQRGIYPLKNEERPAISELLAQLQEKMANNPPPWLAKVMDVPVEDRIRFRATVET